MYGEIPSWQSNGMFSVNQLGETYIPEEYVLFPAYPNPFNPSTNIRYHIANDSHVFLAIYNVRGEKIETIMDGTQLSGEYNINWDAADYSSGVYFIQLTTQADQGELNHFNQKIMLIK